MAISHRIFFLCALGALFPALSGAEGTLEPPVLRASIASEPVTLDWNDFRTESDRFVITFLMRGLLKAGGNKPVCDLCKSMTTSADGKTLTFELAESQWSDGVKLEAKHFVDSLERLLSAGNHFQIPEDFRRIVSVKALTPVRLEIRLSKRSSTIPDLLTTVNSFPIRKELLGSGGDHGQKHAQSAVLGPYVLAEWSAGKRIVLEGNPKFLGARPVYRVEFLFGAHAALAAKFKAGKLEILSQPTTEDVLKLPHKRVQVNPYLATRLLVFNVKHAPLNERGLRRAILHVLDRESLPGQLGTGERRATGLIPPGLRGYRELPLVSADASAARPEFTAAMAGGRSPQLKLLVRDGEEERKVAGWLLTRLGKLNLDVKTEFAAPAEYAQKLQTGAFDLALTILNFGTASPLEALRTFRTGSPRNPGGWTHVAYDGLIDRLLEGPGEAEEKDLIDKATQILESQETAVIPLGYLAQPFLLSSRVSSFATTPFGDPDLVRIQLKNGQ